MIAKYFSEWHIPYRVEIAWFFFAYIMLGWDVPIH